MDFKEIQQKALEVRSKYAELEKARIGRAWTEEDIMLGLVGDIGELAQLIQGHTGVRKVENLNELLEHEFADCLWAIIVLADKCGINLEKAFFSSMNDLEGHIKTKLEASKDRK